MKYVKTIIAENDSWEKTQEKLANFYRDHSLESTLRELYHYHINAGYIHSDILTSIGTNILVDSHILNYKIIIQLNEHRSNRGVPPIPNPNPINIIPYKDGVPCFCCLENIKIQWPEERGFQIETFGNQWIFIPNVAPLFPMHFTIISPGHSPQKINCIDLMEISRKLPQHWIIQNGALAGATNPWHHHFQSFQGELPLPLLPTTPIGENVEKGIGIEHLYKFSIRSHEQLVQIQRVLEEFESQSEYQKLNLLAQSTDYSQTLYVALRDSRKRYSMYKTGQPGYAELGGMISTVRQEAFESWKENAKDLYKVLLSEIKPDGNVLSNFESALKRSL